VFAALLAFTAVAFSATYFITKSYARRQDSLARYWLQQGDNDLRSQQPAKAVADYRTALLYSHDDPAYRLRLAQALAADGHTSQAIAYFLNLLDEQPGNGLYNLELARLYSREGDERKAARYYNGAIYGAWDTDPAVARRNARTEFIQFLLGRNSRTQAQAEAIVLASGVPPNDVAARFRAANLLLNTGEYDRALEEFSSLSANDPIPAAFGAGQAAFQSGKFQSAAKYLTIAVSKAANQPAQALLDKTKQVLDADPNRRRLSSGERARRVSEAFQTAGQRLALCGAFKNQQLQMTVPATDLQKLYAEWSTVEPTLNEHKLAADPDLRDAVMDLVSRIELTTAQQCGTPSGGPDWALLMLARYGEGVEH